MSVNAATAVMFSDHCLHIQRHSNPLSHDVFIKRSLNTFYPHPLSFHLTCFLFQSCSGCWVRSPNKNLCVLLLLVFTGQISLLLPTNRVRPLKAVWPSHYYLKTSLSVMLNPIAAATHPSYCFYLSVFTIRDNLFPNVSNQHAFAYIVGKLSFMELCKKINVSLAMACSVYIVYVDFFQVSAYLLFLIPLTEICLLCFWQSTVDIFWFLPISCLTGHILLHLSACCHFSG